MALDRSLNQVEINNPLFIAPLHLGRYIEQSRLSVHSSDACYERQIWPAKENKRDFAQSPPRVRDCPPRTSGQGWQYLV